MGSTSCSASRRAAPFVAGLVGLVLGLPGCGGTDGPTVATPVVPRVDLYEEWQPLVLEEAKAAPSGTVPLGTRAKMRPLRFFESPARWLDTQDDMFWIEGDAGAGLTLAHDLLPVPLPTEARYVYAASTVLTDRPGPGGKGLRRFGLGERTDVFATGAPRAKDHLLVVEDGVGVGFVQRADLGRAPPTGPKMLQLARSALEAEQLVTAERYARFALGLGGEGTREAAHLAAALMIFRGDDEGWTVRRRALPLPVAPKIPRKAAVKVGASAFVAASKLSLRAAPQRKAERIALLPIGTAVEVRAIEKGWAHVVVEDPLPTRQYVALGPFAQLEARAARGGLWSRVPTNRATLADADTDAADVDVETTDGGTPNVEVTDGGSPDVEAADGGPREVNSAPRSAVRPEVSGYLSARFLDGARPEAHALLAQAEASDDLQAQIVLTDRALALAPTDSSIARSLFSRAVKGRRYFAALRAYGALDSLAAASSGFDVEVQRVFGCRGDVTSPKLVVLRPEEVSAGFPDSDDDTRPARFSPKAFREQLDFPAHPFCLGPLTGALGVEPPSPDEALDGDEELGQAARREAEQARVRFARRKRAVERWKRTLAKLLPGGPRVRVTIRNTSAERKTPGARLVIFGYTPVLDGYCGQVDRAERNDIVTATLPAPLIPPGGAVTFFVDIDDVDHTWGVFLADDEDAVARLMTALAATSDGDADSLGADLLPRIPKDVRARMTENAVTVDREVIDACGC